MRELLELLLEVFGAVCLCAFVIASVTIYLMERKWTR